MKKAKLFSTIVYIILIGAALLMIMLFVGCSTTAPANRSTKNNTSFKVKYCKTDKTNPANHTTRSLIIK